MAIGTDIVRVARVERLVQTYGMRFVERWFTVVEIDLCRAAPVPAVDFAEHLAGKEAVVKTLGLPPDAPVSWHDIEVVPVAGGVATVRLSGTPLAAARQAGITSIRLSLASAGDWAVATAVASTNPADQSNANESSAESS